MKILENCPVCGAMVGMIAGREEHHIMYEDYCCSESMYHYWVSDPPKGYPLRMENKKLRILRVIKR